MGVHVLGAAVVAGLVIALAALVLASLLTGQAFRVAVDRLILAILAALALTIVIGEALLITGPGPHDPLHLLYAGVALVTLPIARFGLPAATVWRRSWWLLGACVVLVGLLVRLLQTG